MIKKRILYLLVVGILSVAVLFLITKKEFFKKQDKQISLNMALGDFKEYMKDFLTRKKIPRKTAECQKDLLRTKKNLLAYASTNHKKTIPLSKLKKIKKSYKKYIKFLYPKHFASKETRAGFVTRRLAKKRIKAEVLSFLEEKGIKDKTKLQALWKQTKHKKVNPYLDQKAFIDEEGFLIVTQQDVPRITKTAKQYAKSQIRLVKKRTLRSKKSRESKK